MRGYECYIKVLYKKNLLVSTHTACWATIKWGNQLQNKTANYNFNPGFKNFPKKIIYIYNFRCEETEKYIPLLINIINQITPCRYIKAKGEEFIVFKKLSTYTQNLTILSFIRNLWYSPQKDYWFYFFEALKISHIVYKDPLERLTWANKEAVPGDLMYHCGHSNALSKSKLKIRTKKELLDFNRAGCEQFLTGGEGYPPGTYYDG